MILSSNITRCRRPLLCLSPLIDVWKALSVSSVPFLVQNYLLMFSSHIIIIFSDIIIYYIYYTHYHSPYIQLISNATGVSDLQTHIKLLSIAPCLRFRPSPLLNPTQWDHKRTRYPCPYDTRTYTMSWPMTDTAMLLRPQQLWLIHIIAKPFIPKIIATARLCSPILGSNHCTPCAPVGQLDGKGLGLLTEIELNRLE